MEVRAVAGFFAEIWKDIKGNAKWDLIKWLLGGGVVTTTYAIFRASTLYWRSLIVIFVCCTVGFALVSVYDRTRRMKVQLIPPKLVIHSAKYAAVEGGGKAYDVTEFMRQITAGNSLVLDIENHNFVVGKKNFVPHDPKTGKEKQLRVVYSYDDEPSTTIERPEHSRVVLPEDSELFRLSQLIFKNRLPELRPKIVPVRYARSADGYYGLFVRNDGEAAFEVYIGEVMIGTSRLRFWNEFPGLDKSDGEKLFDAHLELSPGSGQTGEGLRDEMIRQNIESAVISIFYKDFENHWYLTKCKLARDFQHGIRPGFEGQEGIATPPARLS